MDVSEIVEHLSTGNVVVEAVPGAGKSRLLRIVCETSDEPSLVLAYNAQLALEMSQELPENVYCMTFHALCSRTLQTARDDNMLHEIVLRAERGEIQASNVPDVKQILLDESQDVRELYVRLLRVCGLLTESHRVLVVGDERQLIYDFDDTFPASLALLKRTEETLSTTTPWTRTYWRDSYRLTPSVTSFVNHIFNTDIRSRSSIDTKIQVIVPRTMFRLFMALEQYVKQEDTLVLVDKKQGNRPLRAFLNECSKQELKVLVHGIDEIEEQDAAEQCTDRRVTCGTFWSAKGLQAGQVVILLSGAMMHNPLYVALTRATHNLILVIDSKDVNNAICNAIVALPHLVEVQGDMQVIVRGCNSPLGILQTREPRTVNTFTSTTGRRMDTLCPKRSSVIAHMSITHDSHETTPQETSSDATCTRADFAVKLSLIKYELEQTGRIRHMEDVLEPTRLDSEHAEQAIRKGMVSRWVPRSVSLEHLLSGDLRHSAQESYKRLQTNCTSDEWYDLGNVALACIAWDHYDHLMRNHVSKIRHYCSECINEVEWFRTTLSSMSERANQPPLFDVRLVDGGCDAHCRVNINFPSAFCVQVVWQKTSTDEAHAAVRASMHPKKMCLLVELQSHSVWQCESSMALKETSWMQA